MPPKILVKNYPFWFSWQTMDEPPEKDGDYLACYWNYGQLVSGAVTVNVCDSGKRLVFRKPKTGEIIDTKNVVAWSIIPETPKESTLYDPDGWNDYPEVTPPEDVLMQVEYVLPDLALSCKRCMVFHNGDWCSVYNDVPDEKLPPLSKDTENFRFKRWE